MEFKEFQFVYVDKDYLRILHEVDDEVFFSETLAYEKKPFLGMLTTINNRKYVIPLTSAKQKHKRWKDITATKIYMKQFKTGIIHPFHCNFVRLERVCDKYLKEK